jgi:hypothetical protein
VHQVVVVETKVVVKQVLVVHLLKETMVVTVLHTQAQVTPLVVVVVAWAPLVLMLLVVTVALVAQDFLLLLQGLHLFMLVVVAVEQQAALEELVALT